MHLLARVGLYASRNPFKNGGSHWPPPFCLEEAEVLREQREMGSREVPAMLQALASRILETKPSFCSAGMGTIVNNRTNPGKTLLISWSTNFPRKLTIQGVHWNRSIIRITPESQLLKHKGRNNFSVFCRLFAHEGPAPGEVKCLPRKTALVPKRSWRKSQRRGRKKEGEDLFRLYTALLAEKNNLGSLTRVFCSSFISYKRS